MKPDQTVFTENKINLMEAIRISRTPSVVVEVAAQKMSLHSSVFCIVFRTLLFSSLTKTFTLLAYLHLNPRTETQKPP